MINPSITITESYNSNPLSRSADQNVDDDYITTVSPQVRVTSKGKGYNLNISYKMESTTYHEEPANNDISHMARAGIYADITERTSIRLLETYRAAKDALSTIDEGIQTSRDDVTYNNVSLDIDHILNPETSVTLGAALRRSDFANPELFDTMTETASIGAAYRLSEKRSTSLTYIFSNYSSDNAVGENRTETHTLRTGLEEALSPTLAFDLSGGLVYTPDISEDYDWSAETNLTKTLKRTTATIGYSRSISNSSGLSGEINVNDRVNIGFDHSLSESISLSLSGALTKSRSKPSGTVDLYSYSADLGVSWQPYRWMAAGIGYSKFKQLSDSTSTLDIDRDRVYLSLTLTPQQWRL